MGNLSAATQVSFIIPAYNEQASIEQTILSVIEGEFKINYEVIVVDHNSSDNTAELAKAVGARVVSVKGGTIASVRNYGVSQSRGDILVFLDADVSITKGWYKEFRTTIKLLTKAPFTITGSHCISPKNGNWIEKAWFDSYVQEEKVTNLGSGHLITSRYLFDTIKGFNEELVTGEDYDFCMKAIAKNAEIINNPQLVAIHRDYPENIVEFIKREAWHGLGDVMLFKNIYQSKVALASLAFLSFHFMLFAALLGITQMSLAIFSLLGLSILLLGSSWLKFNHCNIRIIITNSFIYYLYFLGRSASFFIALRRRLS